MSVASHLAVSPARHDAHIRSLIPLYDELIAEVARALGHAARPLRIVVDLGIGTGALARACLEAASGARIWGIDADPDMIASALASPSTYRGAARRSRSIVGCRRRWHPLTRVACPGSRMRA
jgi:2-polyprenyl-3-methyl-5-hydroxy-6-metoxy-1,4-benzoquinol methylase